METVSTPVEILKAHTRVIYESADFQDYHRNESEAVVVGHGPTMPNGGVLHYIRFKDGAQSVAFVGELTPIK